MPRILSVQLADAEFALIQRVAKLRGEDLSSFVRRSIKLELLRLGYLTEAESEAFRPEIAALNKHA